MDANPSYKHFWNLLNNVTIWLVRRCKRNFINVRKLIIINDNDKPFISVSLKVYLLFIHISMNKWTNEWMNCVFSLVRNYYDWEHTWAIINAVCISTAYGALIIFTCYSASLSTLYWSLRIIVKRAIRDYSTRFAPESWLKYTTDNIRQNIAKYAPKGNFYHHPIKTVISLHSISLA